MGYFSFDRFIAIPVIKFLHVFFLIIFALAWIATLISLFVDINQYIPENIPEEADLRTFGWFGLIWIPIQYLLFRIWLELVIVLFKIYRELKRFHHNISDRTTTTNYSDYNHPTRSTDYQ